MVDELLPGQIDIALEINPLRYNKNTFSGVTSRALVGGLALSNPDEVIIVGVCTDICVFATAFDVCSLGYNVTIPLNCIAPANKERGAMLLQYLVDMFGVKLR